MARQIPVDIANSFPLFLDGLPYNRLRCVLLAPRRKCFVKLVKKIGAHNGKELKKTREKVEAEATRFNLPIAQDSNVNSGIKTKPLALSHTLP